MMTSSPTATAITSPSRGKGGRPRAQRDVGPTPQTVANHKPDTLKELLRLDLITKAQAMAGEDVLRAWTMITGVVDNSTKAGGGGGEADSPGSVRLQATYRRWCWPADGRTGPDELYRRCMVRPDVIVDYIKTPGGCDTNPAGAMGLLKRALDWWIEAEEAVQRDHAAQQRAAAGQAA